MKAIERIEKRWITDEKLQGLDMGEAKCVIDALALMVYADLRQEGAEAAAFESASMSLPFGWSEIADLEAHAASASASASALGSEDEIVDRVVEVAASIPSQVREQVLGMVIAIAVSDSELHENEAGILNVFAQTFEIEEDRAGAIFEEIVAAMGLEET